MFEIKKLSELTKCLHDLDVLKAVIFDLDDTLYNEIAYVQSGYKQIAAQFEQPEKAYSILWNSFLAGKPAIDELVEQYAGHLHINNTNSIEEIEDKDKGIHKNPVAGRQALKNQLLQIYRTQRPDIYLNPEVCQLLQKLHQAGYFIGIITDGRPEGQHAKIEALQLDALTDAIIITDELGGIEYRKPHPLAFQLMREKACKQLGMEITYEEMCYIGDNIRKDFIAPQKLGMQCIWYHNPEGLYQ